MIYKFYLFFKFIIARFRKQLFVNLILILTLTICLTIYLINDNLLKNFNIKYDNSNSELWRVVNTKPESDFWWDEFHSTMLLENFEIIKNSYILEKIVFVRVNHLDSNYSDKAIFTDENYFKILGKNFKFNSNLNNHFYSIPEDTTNFLNFDKIYQKVGEYPEINKRSVFSFPYIIPLKFLNYQKNEKIFNIVLICRANSRPEEIEKYLPLGYYVVKIYDENLIGDKPFSNQNDKVFLDFLNLINSSLIIISIIIFWICFKLRDKESNRIYMIFKVFGSDKWNYLIINLFDFLSFFIVFFIVSIPIVLLLSNFEYEFKITEIFPYYFVIFIVGILFMTFIAAIKLLSSIKKTYIKSLFKNQDDNFFYPFIIVFLSSLLILLIFSYGNYFQIREQIYTKVIPESLLQIELNGKIVEFKNNYFENYVKLSEKEQNVKIINTNLDESFRFYRNLLNGYKMIILILFIITGLSLILSILNFTKIFVSEIAILKTIGAKIHSRILYINRFVIKIVIFSSLISIIVSFFLLSTNSGKFLEHPNTYGEEFLYPLLMYLIISLLISLIASIIISLINPINYLKE